MNRTPSSIVFIALAAAAALALGACSSGSGFGSPPPYPNGPQPGQTNQPEGSGGNNNNQNPNASPTPNTPLSVDSASARFGYDASAADPVKAPHLVELTFALQNPTAASMQVSSVAIAADDNPATNVALALSAAPKIDTQETMVAVAAPSDDSDTKNLTLTFSNLTTKGPVAEDTIDYPQDDGSTMTDLDSKVAVGAPTLDDIAITPIIAPGKGLHFDLTFSMTNPSKKDVNVVSFTITPPKEPAAKPGDQPTAYPVKIVIPTTVPARNEMAPVSIVVPYEGKAKSLPAGTYDLVASDKNGNPIAENSGPLL